MNIRSPYPPDEPDDDLYASRGRPPFPEEIPAEAEVEETVEGDGEPVEYRGAGSDPTFGFIVAVGVSLGMTPLIPDHTDLRFVAAWGVLAFFGVLAWLLGRMTRIQRETADNLIWGVIFGAIIGAPLLAVAGSALATMADLLFRSSIDGQIRSLSVGSALALVVFVQPLAETLFFRGMFQENRPFVLVALLATVWSILLFFPLLDIGQFPLVGVVIGTALLMMNLIYSYVRLRNGLAAAWLCQITLNVILLFLPYISN